jgi:hypothetical protein
MQFSEKMNVNKGSLFATLLNDVSNVSMTVYTESGTGAIEFRE